MKKIIKDILTNAINHTYQNSDFTDLIEVQNVTAKNVEADFFSNISMKLAKELKESIDAVPADALATSFSKAMKEEGVTTIPQSAFENIVAEAKPAEIGTTVQEKRTGSDSGDGNDKGSSSNYDNHDDIINESTVNETNMGPGEKREFIEKLKKLGVIKTNGIS